MTRPLPTLLLCAFLGTSSLWSADARATELADAEQALQKGDVEGALLLVRQRVSEVPDDVSAHELLIDLMMATGQSKAATEAYDARARSAPSDADAFYLLGRVTLDPATSEAAFNRALVLQPGHPRALTGLAAVLRSRNQLDEAEAAYEAALGTAGDLSEAWAGLRAVQMMRGDPARLAAVSRRAIAADPGDPQHWLAAAVAVPAEGPDLLDQGLKRHPDHPDLLVARARVAFERADWKAAARSYQRALEVGTSDLASVHVEAALVQEIRSKALSLEGARELLEIRGLEDSKLAIQRLDDLVEAHPHSGWARLVRGNLWAARGATVSAEEDLRAAITRMPSTPEAWSALGTLLLGTRRAAEARPLLVQARDARPRDVSLAVAAAVSAAESGDIATAERELKDAMQAFPQSPGPPLGIARLYLSAGQPDAALEVIEIALERRPDINLAGALVAAAQEAGKPQAAIDILDRLAIRTGDPRLKRVADGLRATAP